MPKCKDCYFCDYRRTGPFHGYYYCVLDGTKRVNEMRPTTCEKFKQKEVPE